MKKNILVVDDSALMRRVICDIINSDETFQAIDTCRDGLDALEKLRAKRYDGVVLDVNMPRMDGLALLEQLQKKESVQRSLWSVLRLQRMPKLPCLPWNGGQLILCRSRRM